ncbi:MAG: hypothetical protein ABJK39_04400 [Hyphomicrobiales bacterium]
MKKILLQTLSVSFLVGAFATQSAHASSGEPELICDVKGGLIYEGGQVSYAEENGEPKVLTSKETAQTPISIVVDICETKDGSRFSTFEENVLVNVEHDNPWTAGQKINSLFMCTGASDTYPNQSGVDTNCVRKLTTIQSLKDTSLSTQNYVDGKQVDELPAAKN